MSKYAKTYETYVDIASYEYINKIPEGWKLLPNIAIFDERISKGHDNEELLSVTIGRGIIKQSDIENRKDISNEDKSNYKLVKIGDIAYNKMRMWQGAVGVSQYRGIVSPAYVILKSKVSINAKYFHYMFRTVYYNNYSKRYSYGLCDDQLNLRYNDFKRMYSILPPINAQNRIVEYLEVKTKQAEELVSKKEKMIELLNERKKAVITNAVMRGLNGKENMRQSGVDWLGKIPQNWGVRKLKHCVKLISEQVNAKENDEIFVSLERIESWTGKYNLEIGTEEFESSVKRFKANDVLFGRLRPYLAKVITPNENGVCVGELLVLRPSKVIDSEFLKYILLSEPMINLIDSSTFGAKMPRANWDFIGQIHIPIPTVEEQKSICKCINNRIEKINKLITDIRRDIFWINNYLESLVHHVVTGQVKVE